MPFYDQECVGIQWWCWCGSVLTESSAQGQLRTPSARHAPRQGRWYVCSKDTSGTLLIAPLQMRRPSCTSTPSFLGSLLVMMGELPTLYPFFPVAFLGSSFMVREPLVLVVLSILMGEPPPPPPQYLVSVDDIWCCGCDM